MAENFDAEKWGNPHAVMEPDAVIDSRLGYRFRHCRLLERLDLEVAERNRAVIALQEDRARLVHVVVQLAAGAFAALDIVVDFFAVENHGDLVANDGGLDGLPL